MAGNLGFDVILVSDATATFERQDGDGRNISADDMHRIHLASLSGEFCQLLPAAEVCDAVLLFFQFISYLYICESGHPANR